MVAKLPAIDNIQELARCEGPCITLLLPPYRPGEQARPVAGVLKSDLQEAVRLMARLQFPERTVADLLKPLEKSIDTDELWTGSHWGRVIFRSPDLFQQFDIIQAVKPRIVVGGSFDIRSILQDLHMPAEFYVLKLAKDHTALLKFAHLGQEHVRLPKGVPERLEEALCFNAPDHDLVNRSASGPSTGGMHGARFGTGTGRETQKTYLADFYKTVDFGICELLRLKKAPLILAGVEADASIYRSINGYPNLLKQSVQGSQGEWTEGELLQKALAIIRADRLEQAAVSLAESKERVSPARFQTDLDEILKAAGGGRVHSLYVDESAQRTGIFLDFKRGGRSNWGEEDLLNLAVIQTILHGGQAFALPARKMPDGAAVASVLRF